MTSSALALVQGTTDVIARWSAADVARALTAVENARAAGFRRRSDAQDFVAAHLLAREAVVLTAGGQKHDVRLASTCLECGSDRHGAPRILGAPELAVSLSHARGVVAAAVAFDAGGLGIDVEPVVAYADTNLVAAMVMTLAEQRAIAAAPDQHAAFLSFWVCKEALVKAGVAELASLATVDLASSADSLVGMTGPSAGWGGRVLSAWSGRIRGAGDVVAAVAAPGDVSWHRPGSGALGELPGNRLP